ncbi:hypothetical conserved protein [Candidatus Nitrosoglobus terrae]|uniref:Hypothetical conserved protein n=1 Tax=Candidatus Nitrosoglobus terrae TaxID=1630141 RepID=A0A1Q2SKD5_9GAMM|nr:MlaD family protein [Candidatus Nitrosoglobus terrae]BAW79580.1 hypothetical conserved protein [Candidatus Nitrosoglobus terrae]
MGAKVNYAVVGLFVVLLTAVLIAIIFWLSAYPSTQSHKIYLAYMKESVAGLAKNADVKYRGVNIGKVQVIELDKENPERVRLTLGIDSDTPIKEDTIAILASNGLTGITYVELTGGTNDSPDLKATKDQPYPVINTGPSLLVRLDSALTELLTELTGVAKNLDHIAQSVDVGLLEKNQQAITETLENTKKFSKSINNLTNIENQNAINEALRNTQRFTNQLEAGAKQIPTIVSRVNKTTEGADALLQEAQKEFRLFSQVTLPRVNQLLSSFNQVTQNLEHFSKQVDNNPRVLLFGATPAEHGPGE